MVRPQKQVNRKEDPSTIQRYLPERLTMDPCIGERRFYKKCVIEGKKKMGSQERRLHVGKRY